MQKALDTTSLPSRIHLQAIDAARNIARDYRIEANVDLFGHWIICLQWGRIGTKGQSRTISFEAALSARRFIASAMARRRSAKRRIGVEYCNVDD